MTLLRLKIRLYCQRCPVFCHCPSLWLINEPFGKSLSFNLFDFERCVRRQSLCFFPFRCRRSFEKFQCALTQFRIRSSLAFVYYNWWLIPEHLLNFFGNPPILSPFSFLFSQFYYLLESLRLFGIAFLGLDGNQLVDHLFPLLLRRKYGQVCGRDIKIRPVVNENSLIESGLGLNWFLIGRSLLSLNNFSSWLLTTNRQLSLASLSATSYLSLNNQAKLL